jgi:hypothetical protein
MVYSKYSGVRDDIWSPGLKPSARKEQDAIVVRCVLATETALLATVPVRTRIVTRM